MSVDPEVVRPVGGLASWGRGGQKVRKAKCEAHETSGVHESVRLDVRAWDAEERSALEMYAGESSIYQ